MFNLSKIQTTLKPLCCYVLIPQEIKISRLVGKERKGSWGGAEMFWTLKYPQHSDMITTELFSLKLRLGNLGKAFQDLVFTVGS